MVDKCTHKPGYRRNDCHVHGDTLVELHNLQIVGLAEKFGLSAIFFCPRPECDVVDWDLNGQSVVEVANNLHNFWSIVGGHFKDFLDNPCMVFVMELMEQAIHQRVRTHHAEIAAPDNK